MNLQFKVNKNVTLSSSTTTNANEYLTIEFSGQLLCFSAQRRIWGVKSDVALVLPRGKRGSPKTPNNYDDSGKQLPNFLSVSRCFACWLVTELPYSSGPEQVACKELNLQFHPKTSL